MGERIPNNDVAICSNFDRKRVQHAQHAQVPNFHIMLILQGLYQNARKLYVFMVIPIYHS